MGDTCPRATTRLPRDGLIHHEVYREVPPKVKYSLTEIGQTLTPLILLMCDWGRHMCGALTNREQRRIS